MKSLFPTLLHEFTIPDFAAERDSLIEYCYNEFKADQKGRHKSNRGKGWQSQDHYCVFQNPLNTTLTKVLRHFLLETDIFEKGTEMACQAMWININYPGSYNIKHDHPNSDLSGVFWIKAGADDMGELILDDPFSYSRFQEGVCYSIEYQKKHGLCKSFNINPQEGELVIFPSNLEHSVDINNSKEERISVSFNLKLDIDFNSANIR
tara:strand:+ start:69 stop:689 length:621 start_codon:yes stop_codon:yes gene_type:complete